MERTINGRPLREVFEKLRKDIPGVIRYTDRTEYPYLEVNVMRNYFDELIPVSNYDFIIDEAKLYQTESSANACVVARIVLYDDAGIKVCEKCYTGTSEAKKSKDTGELLDIPGTIHQTRRSMPGKTVSGCLAVVNDRLWRRYSSGKSRKRQGKVITTVGLLIGMRLIQRNPIRMGRRAERKRMLLSGYRRKEIWNMVILPFGFLMKRANA